MGALRINLNPALALCVALALPIPALSQEGSRLEQMYTDLKTAPPEEAKRLGREIRLELSKSGSPAMNLLLKRGRDAMAANDLDLAIEILSALTDHAPDFAEGWHARSVAFARADMPGAAIGDLERALALDPRNFAAIYSLGALLESVGRPDLALDAYARVAEIHPHFDDTEANMARISADTRGADL